MASGILALFDDIAMLLDDAAAMGKLAVRKTAGLLGDDLQPTFVSVWFYWPWAN